MSDADRSRRRAEDVARASYGRLLAILSARSGDIMAAEDALAEAFEQALRTWPETGVPDRPEAWLLTVARRRRIDAARRAARVEVTDAVPEMAEPETDAGDLPDPRLALMFVCAHPAIDPAIRTPLMLQTVLGIEAAEIAKAFLVPPSAMAQRLVRAKRKIRDARIPFVVPERSDLSARMAAVLEAVYGAYAIDWIEGDGALAHEALFLASILAEVAPEDPEALGLAALIGFAHARRAARAPGGVFVPLHEQDVTLWDAGMAQWAAGLLTRASGMGRIGRFQLEAAIQSVHAARRETGVTDWRALSQLYTGLTRIAPSLGAAVSHAAVVGEDAGPAQGLALLDALPADLTASFQPALAVRAHLLARLARVQEAAAAYDKAISLSTHLPTRAWLEVQRSRLSDALI